MTNDIRRYSLIPALGLIVLGLAPFADAQVGRNMGVLNPNLATESDMAGLPHLTPTLIEAIADGRPFASMLEVHGLLGSLTDSQREELYARFFLPLNLNDTSEEEVLLIPGVGDRMAHEFEEYKPYAHLAVFRREIGKYVDDDEVARLEQFVFVPIRLNDASDEDILTIPGLGSRMLGEFKEYRPYTAMAQFRREIGKYVDDDEVARLERYLTID